MKVLNGPGLPHGQQGMIQTGAPKGHPTWCDTCDTCDTCVPTAFLRLESALPCGAAVPRAGRLSRSCTELVGHVGEDELYAGYRPFPSLTFAPATGEECT